MTPKILDIQRRLDEKLINPKDLTPGQRNALDEAFDQGILKGYDSVGEMIKERRLASEDIAGEIKKIATAWKSTTRGYGINQRYSCCIG